MVIMHVLIIFNFWLLHNLKDTLVVTAVESGAESINFIKMWAVFPVSIFFVMLYTWLANRVSQQALFYGIFAGFAILYFLFATFMYPYREALHMSPSQLLALKQAYPHIKWFFPMVGYWSYTLFYVVSEMWGAVALTLLFWQFANQITHVEQARRFYMMYGSFSAFGMFFAGVLTIYLNRLDIVWDTVLLVITWVVILNCCGIILCYWWMDRFVVAPEERYHRLGETSDKEHMIKLSLKDSFRHIIRSNYLLYLAVISIAYNIAINLAEITWKSQVKIIFPTKQGYSSFMGDFNIWLSFVMFFTGIIGVNVVRKFSWYTSAMVTPAVMFIVGAAFFLLTVYGDTCFSCLAIGVSPVIVAIWVGLFQNLSARCTKQSFFNATREMAYIPLDAESKVKGKAAIDVLSGRIGKLGGSAVQQFLLIIVGGSQLLIAPYLGVAMMFVIIVWMIAVGSLNQAFTEILKKKK